ncbi:DUF2971 domain-containing protein [Pseudomonas paralactis]|uniref:DUF2971 domain-containing protein n=2 Tax=Pseudomonas TaxID=286 RepID=UPI0034D4A189
MTDFLYRFRSVDRLLGNDERTGELEGQYIYFASPEQLNDPIEGYRELYFSGDKIVWASLFKYYIRCLALRSLQYLVGRDISDIPFPVITSLNNVPVEVSEKTNSASDIFLKNENIIKFVEHLSTSERRVTKHELLTHLRSMHLYAFHLVTKIYADIGLVPHETKILTMTEDELLRSSTGLLAETKNLDGLAYEAAIYAADGNQFLKNYSIYKSGDSSSWHKITLNFADDFIESLRELTHEKWYTACFMDSCSNSSIWGSYGDNHAGVCMRFKPNISNDKQSLPFHMPIGSGSNGIMWGDNELGFYKVKYEGTHPDLDFFRTIGICSRRELEENWYSDTEGNISTCADVLRDETEWRKNYWDRRQESITTKMPDWINENEYRLILENGLSIFNSGKDRCLKYAFKSLEGIIFGIKTPAEDKYKILEVVEALCDKHQREGFQFYQAFHDAETKTIKYRPLLSVSCNKPEATQSVHD